MKTVVVIDGDTVTRALYAQCLAGDGWRVLEAEDGAAGIALVLEQEPDAVICDMRTRRHSGIQVCKLIREEPALRGTRVVLTTASKFLNDKEGALQAGAHGYLIKPILPADLHGALDGGELGGAHAEPAAPTGADHAGPTTIRFWGVRGSIPSPGESTRRYGGNTTCVEVRAGGRIIILDAGSGIRKLGQALMGEFAGAPMDLTLLMTHTHWDHIQGFPFFIPAYSPKVNVRILGYEGAVHGLRAALFEQMQSAFFPVKLNQMASHVTFEELDALRFTIAGIEVTAAYTSHPGVCLGYRLGTPGGDLVFMPDHEAFERRELERQKAAGTDEPAAADFARQQDEKMVAFAKDADVTIADSQYTVDEYPSRLGWGHTCFEDTVRNAIRANARQLFLFHHDPDRDDAQLDQIVARSREIVSEAGADLRVDAASEGAEVVLEKKVAAGWKGSVAS
ncbi:hypothetical protein BH23VER1_BH23VER1_24610 [soil metagenome]